MSLIPSRTKCDLQSVTKLSEREFYLMQVELERLEKEYEIHNACSCRICFTLTVQNALAISEKQRKKCFSVHKTLTKTGKGFILW